jgi:hypothetical protein
MESVPWSVLAFTCRMLVHSISCILALSILLFTLHPDLLADFCCSWQLNHCCSLVVLRPWNLCFKNVISWYPTSIFALNNFNDSFFCGCWMWLQPWQFQIALNNFNHDVCVLVLSLEDGKKHDRKESSCFHWDFCIWFCILRKAFVAKSSSFCWA